MQIDLKGRVAIVAASTAGMGLAGARLLAEAGADMVVLSRDAERVRDAEAELKKTAKGRVLALRADVSRLEDIERVVRETKLAFGRVDILVNNAGGPKPGRLETLTEQDWAAAFELTLMSVVRFSRLVAPIMKENKFGRIINITSIIAKSPSAGMGLSASLRAGVLGFAKTLALETARDGITVNSLCPGAVETDRFRRLMELDAADEKTPLAAMREKVRQGIPTGFIADPADFAQAILFLASPEARYITGTALSVDGGEYRGLM